ncbi:MAG: GNAT family N-acetyltransferase [Brachybacterium sp.]|uniref:GNAT family N-acetyltransferase n=1 Tax=Brachybacterium sp. TaxID=1891286 RepID=UPI002648C14F|nr:GNAT family N-acetyltransferase [Brachybacterium sp.]MDN5688702.1 GNAT family N-acetyltransferase [Brachybacterium sp.]
MEPAHLPSYAWREEITDHEVSALHAAAFDREETDEDWTERLQRHSLGWGTARRDGELIGFCNVVTDGGRHAFLVDTVVHPDHQGGGIGRELVIQAIGECRAGPVQWLHVDFEADVGPFYLATGLFRPTAAGLMRV